MPVLKPDRPGLQITGEGKRKCLSWLPYISFEVEFSYLLATPIFPLSGRAMASNQFSFSLEGLDALQQRPQTEQPATGRGSNTPGPRASSAQPPAPPLEFGSTGAGSVTSNNASQFTFGTPAPEGRSRRDGDMASPAPDGPEDDPFGTMFFVPYSTEAEVNEIKRFSDRLGTMNDNSKDEIKDLHGLIEMGRHGMTSQHMKVSLHISVKINNLAALLSEHLSCDVEAKKLLGCMKDLWEDNFRLTKHQDDYLLEHAKELAIKPDRTSWRVLQLELEEETKNMNTYANIWNFSESEDDKAAATRRENVLISRCAGVARNARNQLRTGLKDSVDKKPCSFYVATIRLRVQLVGDPAPGVILPINEVLHTILMRAFVLDTLWAGTDATSKLRPKAAGRPIEGEAFFSKMDNWFKPLVARLGTNFGSLDWLRHMQPLIERDIRWFGYETSSNVMQLPNQLLPAGYGSEQPQELGSQGQVTVRAGTLAAIMQQDQAEATP
ncbi:hypothetical protein PENSPDRAFT_645590 [Peniophora sp. CONT]|nr:hypothetical protein PENSPDRAFT_645590 [Peniophora sp. CONT]